MPLGRLLQRPRLLSLHDLDWEIGQAWTIFGPWIINGWPTVWEEEEAGHTLVLDDALYM